MDQIPEERLAPPLPQSQPDKQPPVCGLLDAAMIAFFFFAAVTLFTLLGLLFASNPARPHKNLEGLLKDAWFSVPIEIAAYLAAIAFMRFLVLLKNRGPFLSAIHWNTPNWGKIWAAVAGGAGLAAFSLIAGSLLAPWTPKSLPISELFRDASTSYLLAFFGVVVAPLGEELFFRGVLYPALSWWMGKAPAVLLTAASFSLLHEGQLAHAWAPLLIIFAVGVALTLAREKTGSVAVCVIIHMTYNFAIFTQLFVATEGFRHMERAALDWLRAALIL